MKQKLTRALIDEIRKEMPVLSQNEEKGVIGGTLYVIGEDGRVLYSNETNSDEVLVSMGSWDGAPTMKLPQGTSFQISSGQLVIEGTSEQNREIYSFLTQNTSVEWSMCVDSSTYHFFAGTNHQEKVHMVIQAAFRLYLSYLQTNTYSLSFSDKNLCQSLIFHHRISPPAIPFSVFYAVFFFWRHEMFFFPLLY